MAFKEVASKRYKLGDLVTLEGQVPGPTTFYRVAVIFSSGQVGVDQIDQAGHANARAVYPEYVYQRVLVSFGGPVNVEI